MSLSKPILTQYTDTYSQETNTKSSFCYEMSPSDKKEAVEH